MKKVGIVCDNYKVSKFREELSAKGFSEVNEKQFGHADSKTTLLSITTEEAKVPTVHTICRAVEDHFKRGN